MRDRGGARRNQRSHMGARPRAAFLSLQCWSRSVGGFANAVPVAPQHARPARAQRGQLAFVAEQRRVFHVHADQLRADVDDVGVEVLQVATTAQHFERREACKVARDRAAMRRPRAKSAAPGSSPLRLFGSAPRASRSRTCASVPCQPAASTSCSSSVFPTTRFYDVMSRGDRLRSASIPVRRDRRTFAHRHRGATAPHLARDAMKRTLAVPSRSSTGCPRIAHNRIDGVMAPSEEALPCTRSFIEAISARAPSSRSAGVLLVSRAACRVLEPRWCGWSR